MKWNKVQLVTVAGIALVTIIYAGYGWDRRWISDDGLIFVRIARQIAAGHGPVFNTFERTEANTSALWPWLIALIGMITGGDFGRVAVGAGLVSSVAGLAIAMDGTRRWHRLRGSDAALVPASALIVIGVIPFLDFATSGLETGLTMLWIGASWWLFATLTRESSRRRQLASTCVFGLGPLVRPDLGIAAVALCIAAWLILRPGRRRTIALIASALALPLGYEIFRAGYYGVLVPLPALAKGATGSEWSRGVSYMLDFATPYWIWLPFAVLVVLLGVFLVRRHGRLAARDRIVLATPTIAAILMGLFVIRVGGDFMHGRMWLPATFLLATPGLVLPLRKFSAPTLAIVVLWAILVVHLLDHNKRHTSALLVNDERLGYIIFTHDRHPVDAGAYIAGAGGVAATMFVATLTGERIFYTEGGVRIPLDPAIRQSSVFVAGRLGLGGAITPLDGVTLDTLGLANPIGARIEMNRPEEGVGHQKVLPWPWMLADFADPARYAETGNPPSRIRAAKRALECGELKELVASVREPLTAGRFFANLVGSVHRTRLAIPSDPLAAEVKFCGSSLETMVVASTSCEDYGWSKANVIDGITHTVIGNPLGYSSAVWKPTDHTEWLELELPTAQSVARVTMYPRDDPGFIGAGFPIDFAIQTWDGSGWVDRIVRTATPPPTAPQVFTFDAPVVTKKVRIFATKLQDVLHDGYVLQLAEVELGR